MAQGLPAQFAPGKACRGNPKRQPPLLRSKAIFSVKEAVTTGASCSIQPAHRITAPGPSLLPQQTTTAPTQAYRPSKAPGPPPSGSKAAPSVPKIVGAPAKSQGCRTGQAVTAAAGALTSQAGRSPKPPQPGQGPAPPGSWIKAPPAPARKPEAALFSQPQKRATRPRFLAQGQRTGHPAPLRRSGLDRRHRPASRWQWQPTPADRPGPRAVTEPHQQPGRLAFPARPGDSASGPAWLPQRCRHRPVRRSARSPLELGSASPIRRDAASPAARVRSTAGRTRAPGRHAPRGIAQARVSRRS